jgi:hypothetical protein
MRDIMKSKGILLVFAVLLGVLAGQITSSLLAQSRRPVPMQTSPTQPAQQMANQTWEYHIVTGSTLSVDSLEKVINEFAAQGFEVQSFQSTQGGPTPTQTVTALLRRPRK